eukprot:1224655-Amphidinium_carterae.1
MVTMGRLLLEPTLSSTLMSAADPAGWSTLLSTSLDSSKEFRASTLLIPWSVSHAFHRSKGFVSMKLGTSGGPTETAVIGPTKTAGGNHMIGTMVIGGTTMSKSSNVHVPMKWPLGRVNGNPIHFGVSAECVLWKVRLVGSGIGCAPTVIPLSALLMVQRLYPHTTWLKLDNRVRGSIQERLRGSFVPTASAKKMVIGTRSTCHMNIELADVLFSQLRTLSGTVLATSRIACKSACADRATEATGAIDQQHWLQVYLWVLDVNFGSISLSLLLRNVELRRMTAALRPTFMVFIQEAMMPLLTTSVEDDGLVLSWSPCPAVFSPSPSHPVKERLFTDKTPFFQGTCS